MPAKQPASQQRASSTSGNSGGFSPILIATNHSPSLASRPLVQQAASVATARAQWPIVNAEPRAVAKLRQRAQAANCRLCEPPPLVARHLRRQKTIQSRATRESIVLATVSPLRVQPLAKVRHLGLQNSAQIPPKFRHKSHHCSPTLARLNGAHGELHANEPPSF